MVLCCVRMCQNSTLAVCLIYYPIVIQLYSCMHTHTHIVVDPLAQVCTGAIPGTLLERDKYLDSIYIYWD